MKPLVFVHGFLGHPSDWRPVISELPTQYDVLTPSLPGHDGAQGTEEISLTNLAEKILETLPSEFHLIGYSLGGRVALKIYEKGAHRVKSITLISAAPGVRTPLEIEERKLFDERWAKLLSEDFESFLNEWYHQPLFGDLSSEDREILIKKRRQNSPEMLRKIFLSTSQASNPHSWDIVRSITVPALFVTGEHDIKYQKIGAEIVDTNPHFRLQIIPGAGHNPTFTHPHATGLVIKDFLQSVR